MTATVQSIFIRILSWIALITAPSLHAQNYFLKSFGDEEGLLDKYIYTINQDERGFLWVGTGNGLFRFDGAEFRAYRGDSAGLAENFVTTSLRDRKGRLWFGHFEGGLTLVEQQKAKRAIPAELLHSRIMSIAEDKEGNIWVASQRNGFVRIGKDGKPQHFPDLARGAIVLSMAVTPNGRMLVGTDEGLKVIKLADTPVFSHDVDSIPLTAIQCIAPHHRRPGFWLGTQDQGLIEYIPGSIPETDRVRLFNAESGFPVENVRSVYEDVEENVWVGTFAKGLARFNDQDVSDRLRPLLPVPGSDTVGACQVECIFGDKFGQVWLGIYNVGMVCMAEEAFAGYYLRVDSGEVRETFSTLEDHDGNIWLGTRSGLYMIERARIFDNGLQYAVHRPMPLPASRHYDTADGLPSNHISAIFEDRNREIWIGTRRDGLCRLNAARDKIVPVNLNNISMSKAVNAISQDRKGNIWVATTDGAFLIPSDSSASLQYFSTRNGLAHNNIYDIFPDSKGRVWLATHTNTVTIFDGREFKSLTVTVQGEVPNINCITEDEKGIIWLGTDGTGLYRFDGESFSSFTEEQGLLSNYCYQLVTDRARTIWIAHRNGLSRFIPETNTFNRYPNRVYFDYEENPIHSARMDSRGNIWYGSPAGITRYNYIPARARVPEPYTYIQSISIFDRVVPLEEDMVLDYKTYRIKFKFLGLTFLHQNEVRYQYKLEGRAPEWSEPTTQNTVTFQGLEEGDYTFMVRACNSMGVCSEAPVSFSFSIRPPFWKTWWFRILLFLALTGMVFVYVRYRITRLNRQKWILEKTVLERTEEIRMANLELERLSLVARETDNAVFILDSEGNLEYVNPGFTRLTGYSLEDALNLRHKGNFLDSSSNPHIRDLLSEVVQTNSSTQYESRLPSRSGEDVWVISTLTPILDEAGNLRKIVIIDSNITEQKKAEEKVREMNSELERLVAERTRELAVANEQLQLENEEHVKTAEQLRVINQELDNFVYRASHDLRGPLASILGLVDIARMELNGHEGAMNYLGLIEKAGKRLNVILVDLIEATQVKQGKIEFDRVNMRDLVKEVIGNLDERKENETHRFELDVEPELEVVSDKRLLTSILQNFIDNSIKYRDPSKAQCTTWVNVRLRPDNAIDIQVRDNGQGIPDELKGKVFDMFFRGTNNASGSGLGLYIVKQAAEKLEGSIDMESKFGEGTTFKVFIPNRMESEIQNGH